MYSITTGDSDYVDSCKRRFRSGRQLPMYVVQVCFNMECLQYCSGRILYIIVARQEPE
jgi:hypothetical protein